MAKNIELIHGMAINQILKSNISVSVFSVERPTLPKWDLINTWCYTRGKSISVVNTVKRPLLKNLFFSSTDIFTLGKGNMGVKIARIQKKLSSQKTCSKSSIRDCKEPTQDKERQEKKYEFVKTSLLCRLRADPSQWSSTNRQNPPIQQNRRNFWTSNAIWMPFRI